MPRLDNSDIQIRRAFSHIDPEEPIDICKACHTFYAFLDDVAHPPYEELDYKCDICGKKLTEEDN